MLKVTNNVFYLDKRKVGHLEFNGEDVVFMTYRTFKKHFFYKLDGYGIAVETLEHLKQKQVTEIKFFITDQNQILYTTTEHYYKHGIKHRTKGFEPQLVLPISHFKTDRSLIKKTTPTLQDFSSIKKEEIILEFV